MTIHRATDTGKDGSQSVGWLTDYGLRNFDKEQRRRRRRRRRWRSLWVLKLSGSLAERRIVSAAGVYFGITTIFNYLFIYS